MLISVFNFSNINFGEKRLSSFTKEDMIAAIQECNSREEIALRLKCSISTLKRRANEWKLTLPNNNCGQKHVVNIPFEDLIRSNNPDMPPEAICAKYGCSTKYLRELKNESGIPQRERIKHLAPLVTPEIIADVYSHPSEGTVESKLKKYGICPSTFYKRLSAANIPTPLGSSFAIAKSLNIQVIEELRKKGLSNEQIAKLFHVSESAIERRKK